MPLPKHELKEEKRLNYVASVSYTFGHQDRLPVFERPVVEFPIVDAVITQRLIYIAKSHGDSRSHQSTNKDEGSTFDVAEATDSDLVDDRQVGFSDELDCEQVLLTARASSRYMDRIDKVAWGTIEFEAVSEDGADPSSDNQDSSSASSAGNIFPCTSPVEPMLGADRSYHVNISEKEHLNRADEAVVEDSSGHDASDPPRRSSSDGKRQHQQH